MADIKWIKLAINMYDDEKIKLIDAMPERDTIHYIWIRILLLGGKLNGNGEIFFSDGKPRTAKMLATLFSRPVKDIRLALKVLSRFGMIEISPNKVIKIVNWNKHQNVEGMEKVREQNRKRAEDYREKKKLERKAAESTKEEINEAEDLEDRKNFEEKRAFAENKELYKNEDFNTNIAETADNNCNGTKNISNVTENENNITVTIQNKNKNKNKKEIENKKKEIETENNNTKSESKEEEDINLKALDLMHYHEKITGKVGSCDYVDLRSAIALHGEKRVKMAMEVGFERNCLDIKYAIGVLKNWRRDGYPEDFKEVKKNGAGRNGKSNSADKNEFEGFKPKEPRKLTEAERRKIEANLI